MRFSPEPLTDRDLLALYRNGSASSLHMLVWHSLIVGTNAQIIVDLGLGNSTRVARSAACITGGTVFSCDSDRARFGYLEVEDDEDWEFHAVTSDRFLRAVPDPVDVAFHDASHEADVVQADLLALFPKMRQFGLIAVHDTQNPRYRLLDAVQAAVGASAQDISFTTLPYGSGLTLLRMETARYEPITPAGMFKGTRVVTVPRAHPAQDQLPTDTAVLAPNGVSLR